MIAVVRLVAARFVVMDYRLRYLRRTHPRWQATVLGNEDAEPLTVKDLPCLRHVLLEAGVGIESASWPNIEPAGCGYVTTQTVRLADDLLLRNERVVPAGNQKPMEAMGAYRMKRNDTVNAARWVLTLWTLSKAVPKTLGASQEAWPVRVVALVYQVAVVAGIAAQL